MNPHAIMVNMDDTNDNIRAELKKLGYPRELTDWQLWILKNTPPGPLIYSSQEEPDTDWDTFTKDITA